MGGLIILVIGISLFGLLFAAYLSRWVLRHGNRFGSHAENIQCYQIWR
jgi:hypothetical protein